MISGALFSTHFSVFSIRAERSEAIFVFIIESYLQNRNHQRYKFIFKNFSSVEKIGIDFGSTGVFF